MVVTIFGLGFVGLTTAVAFADKGITVYGIEVNEQRRKIISDGGLPFFEPGLDDGLKRTLGKTFFVNKSVSEAVGESDCVYYCVGTPYGENGQANLSYLYNAIDTTLSALDPAKFTVLVIKSTVPPSTTDKLIRDHIEEQGYEVGKRLGIANNPEFLREGHCWEDVINADRIILGISDERSGRILKELYAGFDCPIHVVSLNTGEYIKYLSNTLLATLISWANEMSVVANSIGGIEVAEAFRILHEDKRWGEPTCNMATYAYPGCGYGGYCLPKDTNALYACSVAKGFEPKMLKETIVVNDSMPKHIAQQVESFCETKDRIGICGLSFKPDSDDVRDTPAAKIIAELIDAGYTNIAAYDPLAMEEFESRYDYPIAYATSLKELTECSDIFLITTAWSEFKELPALVKGKQIIDARYIL